MAVDKEMANAKPAKRHPADLVEPEVTEGMLKMIFNPMAAALTKAGVFVSCRAKKARTNISSSGMKDQTDGVPEQRPCESFRLRER